MIISMLVVLQTGRNQYNFIIYISYLSKNLAASDVYLFRNSILYYGDGEPPSTKC